MDPESIAVACKALGHPARVRIVKLLADQSECRGADVFGELPLAQSTVSEHLRVLKEAGIVQSRTVGTGAVYCLAPGVLQELGGELSGIVSACTPCEWAR
jgi:ArsR family transcriptional regulator